VNYQLSFEAQTLEVYIKQPTWWKFWRHPTTHEYFVWTRHVRILGERQANLLLKQDHLMLSPLWALAVDTMVVGKVLGYRNVQIEALYDAMEPSPYVCT